MVNICGHSFDDKRNISVYLDGKPVKASKDLISNEVLGTSFEMDGYIPRLLKISPDNDPPKKAQAVSVLQTDNGYRISWKAENSAGANVYMVTHSGEAMYIGSTDNMYYDIVSEGTYLIAAVNSLGTEAEKSFVSVGFGNLFSLSLEDISWQDSGVTASFLIRNNTGGYNGGILRVIARDGDDKITGIAVMQTILKGENRFAVSFSKDTAKIEAAVIDTFIDGRELSQAVSAERTL